MDKIKPIAWIDGQFIFPKEYTAMEWNNDFLYSEDQGQSYNPDDFDNFHKLCEHGNQAGKCNDCDAYEESQGGIDKCLNCGSYKWGKQLDKDQCCKKGCVNPNEY